jgi:hypothetical protein
MMGLLYMRNSLVGTLVARQRTVQHPAAPPSKGYTPAGVPLHLRTAQG